jgi:hypothetical protein
MKRFALIIAAAVGISLSSQTAHAGFGTLGYGGYQPCWNVCAWGKNKCKTPEERRLEQFWHDYYDALHRYYRALEHVDWVAYYKNHGYQINAGCYGPTGCGGANGCCPRIHYAPVFVSPCLQWAVPSTCLNGPPVGPGCCPQGGCPGY